MKKITGEGYIWMSDEAMPRMITELDTDMLNSECNPFINEGMFKTETDSYIIRFSDGKHIIAQAPLTPGADEKDEEKRYCGHRTGGKDIKLAQRWKLTENPNCMGKSEYIPSALIFKGFTHNNTEEEL